ncbi:nucleoside recognition domain-containing protein [Paenibacillus daejeonensis]|uniref:nucleoside recognition domain-containing protein n=1 Tax=Paenibacillus daejeonensis TaxID=135193 RepID=UPI00146D2941|nr:nucleoside recognition domain-containing protein [Paenibacillus daejeonensis]
MLLGFESSGKSALFRRLTGDKTGLVANVRGSTVSARMGRLPTGMVLADLPGIRTEDDSRSTKDALRTAVAADIAVLVVRATHAEAELPLLLDAADAGGKRAVLVLTFTDKINGSTETLQRYCRERLGIATFALDARDLQGTERDQLLQAIREASNLRMPARRLKPPSCSAVLPSPNWFEHHRWGRGAALAMTFLLFAVPVLLAYLFSTWLQPIIDMNMLEPIRNRLTWTPPLAQSILVGDYGLITLGWYSFLWAFPVVVLLGLSVAVAEESGLKDRVTDALDGWMRRIGLHGRDLIPVLSGFGCNVVAVFQSRSCSACSRKACVSMIAFVSACSYQIGASLSLFSSAGHPWLFVPYLLALGLFGALHTRIWHREHHTPLAIGYRSDTFLQRPGIRAVHWRVLGVSKQFVLQAMPIFLGICLTAALLEWAGIMSTLATAAAPVLQLFQLPADASAALVFSVLRKDGLLILNQGEGSLLQAMQPGQVFILVYLASTLTACLVTLWTVRQELGWRFASMMAGRQAITSLVSTGFMLLLLRLC